jgi:hypothetical protein
MNRRTHSISLQEATQESPTLARLASLAADSAARLAAVNFLIPSALRCAIRPGPIEGLSWCLILDNTSVAAKIRQLLPAMQSHLRIRGWEVNAIRLKIKQSNVSL